jgi:cytochrome c553
MNIRTLIILLTALFLPGLAAAGDATSGQALYATCVACHGANGEGNAALNAPGIAGQSESYLARQLWDFKDGRRGKEPGDTTGAQMLPMAAMLADGEAVANVAAYIAAMPAAQPAATVEGDIVNGQKLFTSKCGACHGGQGWGNEALFTPRLTVIGDWYLLRQVEKFQESLRGAHEDSTYGKQMAMMAKTVSADELNDIAAFLNEQSEQL